MQDGRLDLGGHATVIEALTGPFMSACSGAAQRRHHERVHVVKSVFIPMRMRGSGNSVTRITLSCCSAADEIHDAEEDNGGSFG